MTIKNAEVANADVFIEDHGILTFMIDIKMGSTHIGFGGYYMDEHIEGSELRSGNFYGPALLRQFLDTVGVSKVSQLKGKFLRVDDDGHKLKGIGHIVEDRWFYPDKVIAELKIADKRAVAGAS